MTKANVRRHRKYQVSRNLSRDLFGSTEDYGSVRGPYGVVLYRRENPYLPSTLSEALAEYRSLRPPRQYTFQQATQLAFASPGRVFVRVDKRGSPAFEMVVGRYDVLIDGDGESFAIQARDLEEKWVEVK